MTPLRKILIIAVAVLAAACSPAKAPEAPSGKTTIRFATDWRAQAEQGGFYQALATGEYAKRGLDVTIVQGGPGVNVPQLLASGAVELGMGSNSFIAVNLAAANVALAASDQQHVASPVVGAGAAERGRRRWPRSLRPGHCQPRRRAGGGME